MSIYCTYLTTYRGNKLPPFYIGSTSIDKINRGYHGSVRSKQYREIWEEELKMNNHLFKTIIISTHNTRIEALDKEAFLQKSLNSSNNLMYINKSIARRGFDELSQDSIEIIRAKALERNYDYMKGSNHHYWGGRTDLNQNGSKNPFAKKCIVKGKLFDSIIEASKYYDIPYKKCYRMIRNKIENSAYQYLSRQTMLCIII